MLLDRLNNVVVSGRVTDGNVADSLRFKELLEKNTINWTMEEVTADLDYNSRDNL